MFMFRCSFFALGYPGNQQSIVTHKITNKLRQSFMVKRLTLFLHVVDLKLIPQVD